MVVMSSDKQSPCVELLAEVMMQKTWLLKRNKEQHFRATNIVLDLP